MQTGWGFANPRINQSTWYIGVLMMCYLLAYLLLAAAKRLKTRPVYLTALLVLVSCGMSDGMIRPLVDCSDLLRGVTPFFSGVLLGWV